MTQRGTPEHARGTSDETQARDQTRAAGIVVGIGALLRLYGAWRAPLSYDEALIWACVRDLEWTRASIATAALDHPPLGALLVRLSAALFGESTFGLRLLHTLLAAAAPLAIFHLGRALWSSRVGLIGAALLAADQFHVSWSRLCVEDGLLLAIGTAALLAAWRALGSGRASHWLASGLLFAAAALVKETALLLAAALVLALALDPRGRAALRTRGLQAAALAFVVVAGAGYAVAAGEPAPSFLDRDRDIAQQRWGLSAKGLSLYVGEALRAVVDADALDRDYGTVPARAVWWPAGLLYLLAVASALRHAAEPQTRLLLIVFAVVFGAASLVDAEKMFDPYWWASLSLVPAVLLCARRLDAAAAARGWGVVRPALALAAALAIVDLAWLSRPTQEAPRLSRVEWAQAIAADGLARLRDGDVSAARQQARTALVLDPASPGAQELAARLAPMR